MAAGGRQWLPSEDAAALFAVPEADVAWVPPRDHTLPTDGACPCLAGGCADDCDGRAVHAIARATGQPVGWAVVALLRHVADRAAVEHAGRDRVPLTLTAMRARDARRRAARE